MVGLFEALAVRLGRIPQSEIDREAMSLFMQHGDKAVEISQGLKERGEWVKGNSDLPERTSRVHRAVLRLVSKR